ncbi:MAG: uracil-DNA glycosylase [Luteibaculum sp.]
MEVKLRSDWKALLQSEFEQDYFKQLAQFVRTAYQKNEVYPPAKYIFQALELCPLEDLKVVIIGQDPYHGPGQAHGLCFSVQPGVAHPPSLKNIFKELKADVGKEIPKSGDLSDWAKQGILLLNATLTVNKGNPGSHQNQGWEVFTDAIIRELNKHKEGLVYMLWGSFAQRKAKQVNPNKNLLLKAVHPSPLSAHRGFFGSRHFSKCNAYLKEQGKAEIIW